MKKEVLGILEKNITEGVYEAIEKNYEEWRDSSLFELGIDSLNYMALLVDLGESYNFTIEDIESLNTLKSIEVILEKYGERNA
ncbi:acyl carrier protein [Thermoactinomyces sp. DSM 45892]|uniref:acyl carrier protein n=1 Tax=Thermoactinomyces sp. DSM 45892 TaxID=1882753 RepID=UPI000896632E|nr:acyl carrier protein [Thermoactinomyces sp. DSM 45892]SDY23840.1 Phosphopantetheine attachment site [Thermoactinomyces sp. DSM 45892]